MKETWKVYGSKTELASLAKELKTAGFEEHPDEFVRASSQPAISVGITWIIVSGIGGVVKHWLTVRGKRMITRETHGERITIQGHHSAAEIEAAMNKSHAFDIEDDVEPPNPNQESEIGYHVGINKQKDKK
jgi:hypothetical protein